MKPAAVIRFRSVVECVVDFVPAGRRNGIDCGERVTRGLIGLTEDGEIYRFNYDTRDWTRIPTLVREPAPWQPASGTPATES